MYHEISMIGSQHFQPKHPKTSVSAMPARLPSASTARQPGAIYRNWGFSTVMEMIPG